MSEPRGVRYRQLLAEGARCCDQFLFVDVPEPLFREEDSSFGPLAERLVNELAPHLIRVVKEKSWPGTRLGEVPGVNVFARVFTFRLDSQSLEIISRAANNLYAWRPPTLPADLCLIRPDSEPWLVSIAADDEAYLRLARDEAQDLAHRMELELRPEWKH
jgi:hypothetical protein